MKSRKFLIMLLFISYFLACIFTLIKSQEKLPQKPTHIKFINASDKEKEKETGGKGGLLKDHENKVKGYFDKKKEEFVE